MKKICFSLFLLFVPFMSLAADDGCEKPDEYTIDRRCYVPHSKNKFAPYNSVVALLDKKGRNYCTGTIVKGKDNKPYVYTAKHCVADRDNKIIDSLTIKLWSGKTLRITKNNVGNYNEKNDTNQKGDWAIYSIVPPYNVHMVEKTKKMYIDIFDINLNYDARVVGYGSLAIMSDEQIRRFKIKYTNYLSGLKVAKKNEAYGIYTDGVDVTNQYVINFLKDHPGLLNISDATRLKESKCEYSSAGKQKGCQTWAGNSGGPIFDEKGRIMGIHTRGKKIIGGENHAENVGVKNPSIPLF